MNVPIFKWDGAYFGFVEAARLYNAEAAYLGWIEQDGSVWTGEGAFLGTLVEGNYVMRNLLNFEPVPRIPPPPPIPPAPPMHSPPRMPRTPQTGWADALEGPHEKGL